MASDEYDDARAEEGWKAALKLITEQGFDVDAVLKKATENLTHWTANPYGPHFDGAAVKDIYVGLGAAGERDLVLHLELAGQAVRVDLTDHKDKLTAEIRKHSICGASAGELGIYCDKRACHTGEAHSGSNASISMSWPDKPFNKHTLRERK